MSNNNEEQQNNNTEQQQQQNFYHLQAPTTPQHFHVPFVLQSPSANNNHATKMNNTNNNISAASLVASAASVRSETWSQMLSKFARYCFDHASQATYFVVQTVSPRILFLSSLAIARYLNEYKWSKREVIGMILLGVLSKATLLKAREEYVSLQMAQQLMQTATSSTNIVSSPVTAFANNNSSSPNDMAYARMQNAENTYNGANYVNERQLILSATVNICANLLHRQYGIVVSYFLFGWHLCNLIYRWFVKPVFSQWNTAKVAAQQQQQANTSTTTTAAAATAPVVLIPIASANNGTTTTTAAAVPIVATTPTKQPQGLPFHSV